MTGGDGSDGFLFSSAAGMDTVTDFVSGSDKFRFSQAGIRIGDGDTVGDGAVSAAGPGGFAPTNEVVIITGNIAGAISAASAATAIGSATSAYAPGATALFVVDNGTTTGLFLFTSSGADALTTTAELTQVAQALGVAGTVVADYVFA